MKNSTGSTSSPPKSELLRALEKIRNVRTVVVGDDILDHYLEADVVGYANKTVAPVVALRGQAHYHKGGSAMIAAHVGSFTKEQPTLITPSWFVTKLRYITAERRVLFQAIHHPKVAASEVERKDVECRMAGASNGADLLMVCDYGHGLFERGPFLDSGARHTTLNVQSNSWSRGYNSVFRWDEHLGEFSLITLDENELREASHDRLTPVPALAAEAWDSFMVTRGKNGLYYRGLEVPALTINPVDRMGAGDAAYALAALATAADLEPVVVAWIANYAGACKAACIWGNERPLDRQELVGFIKNV